MDYKKIKYKSHNIIFVVLLIYSLLPGIAKISGVRELFSISALVIFYCLFSFGFYIKKSLVTYEILIIYPFYSIYTYLLVLHNSANDLSFYAGLYLYVLPVLGCLSYRKISAKKIIEYVVYIALVHAVIALLFYGFIALPDTLEKVGALLNEGVMAYRMASVSGSIIFAALCVEGYIGSLYLMTIKNKYYLIVSIILLICIILSQQRSALIVAIIFTIIIFKWSIKNIIYLMAILIFLFLFGDNFLENISLDYSRFIYQRFQESWGGTGGTNMISERSEMWISAIQYFLKNPFGVGIGQGGYVAFIYDANIKNGVTDGDYFRILKEFGFLGIILCVSIILLSIKYYLRNKNSEKKFIAYLIWAPSLQMIGSNITEFYFINYIYWTFIGVMIRDQIYWEN